MNVVEKTVVELRDEVDRLKKRQAVLANALRPLARTYADFLDDDGGDFTEWLENNADEKAIARIFENAYESMSIGEYKGVPREQYELKREDGF